MSAETAFVCLVVGIVASIGFGAIARAGSRDKCRRKQEQACRNADRIRRVEENHHRRLSDPIPYDDGLDVGKLEVKHEPYQGEK